MNEWLVFGAAALTVAGSFGAARYAGRATVKTKELDVDAAAYERADKINAAAFQRLEGEVKRQGLELTELRTTVEKVTKAFRTAINFIEQVLIWEMDGTGVRPKITDGLKEYLDPYLVSEYSRNRDGTP